MTTCYETLVIVNYDLSKALIDYIGRDLYKYLSRYDGLLNNIYRSHHSLEDFKQFHKKLMYKMKTINRKIICELVHIAL